MTTKQARVPESESSRPPRSSLLTFLVADMRGYTPFSLERGDAAAAQLSELFLSLCRDVVAGHGGEVFGSAGDQALAAFSSAHAALIAALALRSRLEEEQRVRPDLPLLAGIGLDTGEGVRVGGDYRGNAVNLAARLCSIAQSGDVLASGTVLGVADALDGMTVVDRGEVLLKGIDDPVRVFQVFPDGTSLGELPPLRATLVVHPTNLPDAATPFIGRERELADLSRLASEPGVRLITLTGPGGTGKTRLALRVGATLLPEYQDGVFFVDLAPLGDPALVPSAIAAVLGVREGAATELVNRLAAYLEDKLLLLLLDNFEHVVDASRVVGSLLERCRELRVLVTSRTPLHLSWEHEYLVPPLPVPDPADLPDANNLSRYDAVALFVDRARAVKPGFALTDENAPAVAEICVRLDGLPLAIELAAARIKLFPPQALLQRLSATLTLLTGGARDRPTRQQTIRGAIDWSYSLLSTEEQTLFARLSVFAGGWTFEAAEAVSTPDGNVEVVDGLASLVDQSLVRQRGQEVPRFSMFQTVQEYAREKLRDRGEDETIRTAHAQYFLQLAEEAEPELNGRAQKEWLTRLDEELDNLRLALRWFLDQRAIEDELRLAAALFGYWRLRGYWSEGRRWLEAGLANQGRGTPRIRAKALWTLGYFTAFQGDSEQAKIPLGEALELYQDLGDQQGSARVLESLGMAAGWQGQYDPSSALHQEGVRLFRDVGDQSGVARNLFWLGTMAWLQADIPRAKALYAEALAISRAVGDIYNIVLTLTLQGQIALYEGNLAEAERLGEESLQLAQAAGLVRGIAYALRHLGRVDERQGHLERANERARESLSVAREEGERFVILIDLGYMAGLAMAGGDALQAARLKGAELALRDRLGMPLPPVYRTEHETILSQARAVLGEEALARALQAGGQLSLDEAMDLALGSTD